MPAFAISPSERGVALDSRSAPLAPDAARARSLAAVAPDMIPGFGSAGSGRNHEASAGFATVFATILGTMIGLVYAELIDKAKIEKFAKALIFLPMAISLVGASLI